MDTFRALGWAGQALFFSRFLVQWWQSERVKRSVSPPSFWWLSLIGTILLGVYSAHVHEPVMLALVALNLGIYVRNLLLSYTRTQPLRIQPVWLAGAALACVFALFQTGALEPRPIAGATRFWYALGALGTALWSARFVLQWWQSERIGISHFSRSFWWLSLAGNLLLLAYSLRLGDPLFIAGFLIGPLVQIRNLMFKHNPVPA